MSKRNLSKSEEESLAEGDPKADFIAESKEIDVDFLGHYQIFKLVREMQKLNLFLAKELRRIGDNIV